MDNKSLKTQRRNFWGVSFLTASCYVLYHNKSRSYRLKGKCSCDCINTQPLNKPTFSNPLKFTNCLSLVRRIIIRKFAVSFVYPKFAASMKKRKSKNYNLSPFRLSERYNCECNFTSIRDYGANVLKIKTAVGQ